MVPSGAGIRLSASLRRGAGPSSCWGRARARCLSSGSPGRDQASLPALRAPQEAAELTSPRICGAVRRQVLHRRPRSEPCPGANGEACRAKEDAQPQVQLQAVLVLWVWAAGLCLAPRPRLLRAQRERTRSCFPRPCPSLGLAWTGRASVAGAEGELLDKPVVRRPFSRAQLQAVAYPSVGAGKHALIAGLGQFFSEVDRQ